MYTSIKMKGSYISINYQQKNGYFVEIKCRGISNNQKTMSCHDHCIVILITIRISKKN